MTTLPLTPAYRRPVWTAVVLQVLTQLVSALLGDGGLMASVGGCTMAAFWAGVVSVMWRRPMHPTRLDLLYVRWGYVPLLVIGIGLTIAIVMART
jgi:hypothetical protein